MPAETLEAQRPEVNFLTRVINPTRSRIIGAVFDNSLLLPKSKLQSDKIADFKTKIIESTPEAINFKPVQDASTESRRKYWKDKSFEEQNSEWNSQTWKVIQDMLKPDSLDRDEARRALASLNLNFQNSALTDTGLNAETEKFRATYFEGPSKVKEFVANIAKDCQQNGIVNVNTLERRLTAVDRLLGTFGTQDVSQLVKDYATSYALLSQPREVKEAMTEIIVPIVSQPKQSGLRGLINKIFPFAGIAALTNLGQRQEQFSETTTAGDRTGSPEGRSVGDRDGSSGTAEGVDQGFYETSNDNRDNNGDQERGGNRVGGEDYVDIGETDYGDVPRGGTETGGFGGYGDVGARDYENTARATETGGFVGYRDVGTQDYESSDVASRTGEYTGYRDVGDTDYFSGEPATSTGGYAGYRDIGDPDKGRDESDDSDGDDGDGDGDGDGD